MAKAMKLVNSDTGEMVCKHCGSKHHANLASRGKYRRGSWQCSNPACPSKKKKRA